MKTEARSGLCRAAAVIVTAIALLVAREASAQGLAGYWVDNYGGTNNLINSQANTQGFENAMTSGSFPWVLYFDKGDGRVGDFNFYDPDVTGNSYDNDTSQADSDSGDVTILYYTGHGLAVTASTEGCFHNSDCTTPPSGFSLPAWCVSYPNVQHTTGTSDPGICRYLWTQGAVVHGSTNHHGNFVSFAPNSGVALGETYFSGNWAGAGENGGIKMAVFDQSFGTVPEQWSVNMYDMFAGVHLIATILPVSGDTANVADRGSAFANQYQANPNAAVAQAWQNTLNLVSASEGDPCVAQNGTQYAGYHGINGCGCNWVYSVDSTNSKVTFHITSEIWTDLDNASNDGQGNEWSEWGAICNYPVSSYPFSQ